MNKLIKYVSVIGFAFGLMIFFIIKDTMGLAKYSWVEFGKICLVAFIGSAVAGLVSWWILRIFVKPNILEANIELNENETIIFETTANHFKGLEAVGGKLYLTYTRLVYVSNKLNFQNHKLSIPLQIIMQVDRYRTLGIVNNGLSIMTTDNKKEKFVVAKVAEWVQLLANDKNQVGLLIK